MTSISLVSSISSNTGLLVALIVVGVMLVVALIVNSISALYTVILKRQLTSKR